MTLGGVEPVALAFANTACPDSACACSLGSLADVLAMLVRIGALDAARATHQRRLSPAQQRARVADVLAFRAALIALLESVRTGTRPRDTDVKRVNGVLARTSYRTTLVRGALGFAVRRDRDDESEDLLTRIAENAAELLAGVDAARIKRCREPECTCYFVDTSKNRTRAWCSMQRCGNRAKVATYYRRSRAGAGVPASSGSGAAAGNAN